MKNPSIFLHLFILSFISFLLSCSNSSDSNLSSLLLFSNGTASNTYKTYYISSSDGNDQNDGLSKDKALASLSKVNSLSLSAGDKVLFKKSDTFYGNLNFTNLEGSSSAPIVFASYGDSDEKPIISNQNNEGNVFTAVNSSNVTVQDLEFHVYAYERSNTSSERTAILFQYYRTNGNKYKNITICNNKIIGYGIECQALNANTMGIYIAAVDQNLSSSKSEVLTNCEISSNEVYNIGRTGIHSLAWLEEEARMNESQSKFVDFSFKNNLVNNLGCIGIYISNCSQSEITKNTVTNAGSATLGRTDEGECGIMALASIDCDIAYNTVSGTGDQASGYDGMGIDIDWFTKGINVHHNKVFANKGSGIATMCCVDSYIQNNEIYNNLCQTNNTADIYVTNYTALTDQITGDYLTIKNLVIKNNTITHSVSNGHIFETCSEAANPNGESQNISTSGTSFTGNKVTLTLTDTTELTNFVWIFAKSQNNHSTYLLWENFSQNTYFADSQAVEADYFPAVNPALETTSYTNFSDWKEACDTGSSFSKIE